MKILNEKGGMDHLCTTAANIHSAAGCEVGKLSIPR
jgi:hypothetical protein